jgi:hypothetical protein
MNNYSGACQHRQLCSSTRRFVDGAASSTPTSRIACNGKYVVGTEAAANSSNETGVLDRHAPTQFLNTPSGKGSILRSGSSVERRSEKGFWQSLFHKNTTSILSPQFGSALSYNMLPSHYDPMFSAYSTRREPHTAEGQAH